jgi:hypothetical protein
MTGELLFLRYAFPCAEIRLKNGLISEADYQILFGWVNGKEIPNRKKLKFCFPNAFKASRDLALAKGVPVWSWENITNYWRNHHGHYGICAVLPLMVMPGGNFSLVGSDEVIDGLKVKNIYNLDIVAGDIVFAHQLCLVEKI